MHKLTFFPLGNADCCLIDLDGGQKILFDFAATRDSSDEKDLRIDLPRALRDDLKAAKRDSYDVVAFTHLDTDHIMGGNDFFYLEHAKKYQDGDRVKINTLWVPAAVIIEQGPDDPEARIIQAEARHRLLAGKGIRVFSRPEKLKSWLEDHDLSVEERAQVITDAGRLIPGYAKSKEGVEFFVHSPFASRLDGGELIDRNTDSLVVQATFEAGTTDSKVILGSDIDYQVIETMVTVTKRKKNEARLEWDVFKLPHHCSYLALGPEKGKDKTKPVPEVKWLFEKQGQEGGVIVSPSWLITSKGDDTQPPHRQAANYYRDVVAQLKGEFKVTMEHPKADAPAPLVVHIDDSGITIEKRAMSVATAITSSRTPRAG